MINYWKSTLGFLILTLLFSCDERHNTLVNLVDEIPGSNCPNGGIRIETGIDKNDNNELSSDEVIQTEYVCNGSNSITNISPEDPGANCETGGYKIEIGLDLNNDSILNTEEIHSTKIICNPIADRLIRLPINASFLTRSTEFTLSENPVHNLIKFSKMDYTRVDSITFVPSLAARIDPMIPDERTVAHVELFNITDSQPIVNSELTTTEPELVFLESPNIYNDLPAKEVTLTVRLKSENPNLVAHSGGSYLFIYKH